jgi:hypothetical protein
VKELEQNRNLPLTFRMSGYKRTSIFDQFFAIPLHSGCYAS